MKKFFSYFFMICLLVAGILAWIVFGPTIQPKNKYLYIPTGSNYSQVKDSLSSNDIISNFFVFDRLASYVHYDQKVKPGKYLVTKGMSVFQLIKILRSGRQEPVNLVINTLRTKEDFAKKIGSNFETDSLTVIEFLNNPDSLLAYDVDTNTVMTNVIPNTYQFNWTTPFNKIYSTLYKEKNIFWTPERKEKAQQHGLTPEQIYIIASIVEEETNKLEDKGKIASVYINRLRKGMRLAADPTVKFAMRDFGLKRILHKHLEFSSPYNTYRNSGLPPGPICTPSIKTLDAVLNAPETDYLFFVARADFSGYSEFSTTYEQHLIYAKAYQEALNALIKSKQESEP